MRLVIRSLIFLVASFCLSSQALAASTEDLVVKLTKPSSPSFYGTAILFKIDGDTAYFLTNHHVVGSEKDGLLKMDGLISGGRSIDLRKVGTSPGHDVAVVAAKLKDLDPKALQSAQAEMKKAYSPLGNTTEEALKTAAIVGVEGKSTGTANIVTSKRQSWEEESKDLGAQSVDSSKPVFLDVVADCPAFLLRYCYFLRMKSWGFSGSAFVTGDGNIQGIVSHFSFMTPYTYLIPIDDAIRVANRIIQDPKSGEIDESGSFRILDQKTLEVLKGPLKGKKISTSNRLEPGGGDNAGGGGDNAGGGGSSRALKGFQEFKAYSPGIEIDGKAIHSVIHGDQVTRVESLGDFVRAYQSGKNKEFTQQFPTCKQGDSVLVGVGISIENAANIDQISAVTRAFMRPERNALLIKRVLLGIETTELVDLSQVRWEQVGWNNYRGRGPFRSIRKSDKHSSVFDQRGNIEITRGPTDSVGILNLKVVMTGDNGLTEIYWLPVMDGNE